MPNKDLAGSTPSGTAVVRIDGPSALIACAPFLLGFVPEDSVMVVFTHASRVVLTVRFDLIKDDDVAALAELRTLFESTMGQISAHGVHVDSAYAIVFSSDATHCPGVPLLTVLDQVFIESGLAGAHWFASDKGRMWCYDASCPYCPGEGHHLDEGQAQAAQFDMVSRGYGYAPSRKVLEVSVRPDAAHLITDEELRRVQADEALTHERARREVEDEMITAFCAPLDVECIRQRGALWAIALRDSRVREPIMYRVLTTVPQRQRAMLAGARTWLTELTRCLGDDWVAPTAATLGALAWQDGDGAFARIAAGRALAADPDNTLANLIDVAAGSGVPPYTWRQVLTHFGLNALRRGDPTPPTVTHHLATGERN